MAKKPKSPATAGFTYLGPNTGFTQGKGDAAKDVLLVKGRTYTDLPAEHPVVKNLIARKLLVEPEPKPEPEAEPAAPQLPEA